MPRAGMNPNRHAFIQPFSKVVCLVLTHLPNMDGYHAERLNIVQHSLWSMSHESSYIIVWDNGSCYDFRKWLESYPADRVILSDNIGTTNAVKSVLSSLPPDTIVAVADDDVEYFPNWLQSQIDILTTFPNVGAVSGCPSRIGAEMAVESTLNWAQGNAKIESSRFISDEEEMDFATSIGKRWEDHHEEVKHIADIRVTYNGVSALVGAKHWQYVCYAGRIAPLMQWTNEAMPRLRLFDRAIDDTGLLRLSTVRRYTRHMGNVLG
jgi:hypothetical protein